MHLSEQTTRNGSWTPHDSPVHSTHQNVLGMKVSCKQKLQSKNYFSMRVSPSSPFSFQHNARGLIEDGGHWVFKPIMDIFTGNFKSQELSERWQFERRSIHTVQYIRTWKWKSLFPHKTHRFSEVQALFILPLQLISPEIQKRGFCLGHETYSTWAFKMQFRKRFQ